jgi:chromosome segregation ATPase
MGCPSREEKAAGAEKPPKEAAAQRDKVRTETRKAAQAARDYAYAEKDDFVKAMKGELAEVQGEMDRLSAKVERSSGEAKADAKARLDTVREKWDRAKQQLERAENATESTWEDVKGGFRKLNDELKESFNQTRKWLGDKIAP